MTISIVLMPHPAIACTLHSVVFLDDDIDLVVTGINFGPNLGDDVIYSGTVAGAIEGRFLGLPSVAISLASWEGKHFESAGRVVFILHAFF